MQHTEKSNDRYYPATLKRKSQRAKSVGVYQNALMTWLLDCVFPTLPMTKAEMREEIEAHMAKLKRQAERA